MNTGSLAVLVSSCDAYSDVWPAFFTLFFRYWPDCPYPVYLLTERQSYSDPRIRHIHVGEDRGWASNTKVALEAIPEQHILYLQEDYLLKKTVHTAKIAESLEYLIQERAAVLRLQPTPGPDLPYRDHPQFGQISVQADYSVSLQAAIWDKTHLLALLKEGENGWQMEIAGSRRAAHAGLLFLGWKATVPLPVPYICSAVYKGKWMRSALEHCEVENIPIDTGRRPVWSRWDDCKAQCRAVVKKILRI